MKKLNNKYIYVILVFLSIGLGIMASIYSSKRSIISDLCEYDDRCDQILTVEGEIKPLKREMIPFLKSIKSIVSKYANQFNVDPIAIYSAILIENSISTNFFDLIMDEALRNGVLEDTTILNHEFSVGPGQLRLITAIKVQRHIIKQYSVPHRDFEEIKKMILTIDGSVFYIAAFMRYAIDTYKEYNIDISQKIDIQLSLFNLGNVERRAKENLKNKRDPRNNYFGYYFNLNKESILDILVF